jgi:hypothetical protein
MGIGKYRSRYLSDINSTAKQSPLLGQNLAEVHLFRRQVVTVHDGKHPHTFMILEIRKELRGDEEAGN